MKPGEIIKNAREKKGMTQVILAKFAGLAQGTISDIERGRQPVSRGFIKKVGKVLELTPNEIVAALGMEVASEFDATGPHTVAEDHGNVYVLKPRRHERRVSANTGKRKFLDRIIKILDSGNQTAINAIETNVVASEALIEATRDKEPVLEGGD